MFLILFFLLTFVGVIRDVSVGDDLNGSYLANWNAATLDPTTWGVASEMEVGFMFVMAHFKNLFDNYYAFYGTIFFITMIGFAKIFKEFCYNPILALSFFVLFLFYTTSFNAIRQSLALSLTYPIIKLALKDTKKSWCIFVVYIIILVFLFHRTIIIFILIPFLIKSHFVNSFLCGWKSLLILITSYAMTFATNYLLTLVPELSVILSLLGSRYSNYMTVYLVDIEDTTISYITALLHTLVAMYIAMIYKKDPSTYIFYVCFIAGVVLQNALGAFSALFIRVSYNLLFFEIVLFSNMWALKPYRNNYLFKLVVLLYGLVLFTNSLVKNFNEIVPYNNYLF